MEKEITIRINISKDLISFIKEMSNFTNSDYEDSLRLEISRKIEKEIKKHLSND